MKHKQLYIFFKSLWINCCGGVVCSCAGAVHRTNFIVLVYHTKHKMQHHCSILSDDIISIAEIGRAHV